MRSISASSATQLEKTHEILLEELDYGRDKTIMLFNMQYVQFLWFCIAQAYGRAALRNVRTALWSTLFRYPWFSGLQMY